MRAPAAARAGAGLALLQLTAIDCYVQSTSASALMPVMLVASRWGFSQAERSALLPAAAGRSRSTTTCAPSWLAARWVWVGGRPAGSAAHSSLPAVLVLFSPVVGCLLQPQSCCAFCAWDLQAAKMAGSRPGTGATAGSVIAVQAGAAVSAPGSRAATPRQVMVQAAAAGAAPGSSAATPRQGVVQAGSAPGSRTSTPRQVPKGE